MSIASRCGEPLSTLRRVISDSIVAEKISLAHSTLRLNIASLSRNQIVLKRFRPVGEKLSTTGVCLSNKTVVSRCLGTSRSDPNRNKEDEHQCRKRAGANTNAQPVKMRTANRKRAWHREQNANPKKHRSSETRHEHDVHEWDREQTGGFECEFHDGLRLLAEQFYYFTISGGISHGNRAVRPSALSFQLPEIQWI